MANLVTWLREKDEKWFQPFFDRQLELVVCDARKGEVNLDEADGLLLTGGADIAPQFLSQDVPDPSMLDKDVDVMRDQWEFTALHHALAHGLPIFAICKGMQLLNVGLGGTLKLDIAGHRGPEMRDADVQPLRTERSATHRFDKVNSSHHQAVERLGDNCTVEAWCSRDEIIEQIRVRDHPFALGVQYHPERGKIYDALFHDFFTKIIDHSKRKAGNH